jgi:osmoprotectant transport system permease protein
MKKLKIVLFLIIISIAVTSCSSNEPDIVVGAKDFTEQYILGYILTNLIEANTDLTATLNYDLATEVIFAGLRTGIIDLYVEYTGTVYGSIFNYSETKTPDEIFDFVVSQLDERHNLRMLDRLGFNNTFCLAVSSDTAERYNLTTFSDLARVSSDFIFAGSAEILSRNDGIPNLKRVYNMSFKDEVRLYGVERYTALANNEIQVTEVFSTDGSLLEYGHVVLEDDKNFFPAYQGAIIVRNETLEEHPVLYETLNMLSGVITDEDMRGLNYKVDVLGEDPQTVAVEYLKNSGLVD